jgi:hypothetical protein
MTTRLLFLLALKFFVVIINAQSGTLDPTFGTGGTGRLLEIKNNVYPNQAVKMGEKLRPGIYYIEAIQGEQKKTLKVIKSFR